ncbi:MAG: flagellar export protein FliJ [Gammaproteobacteria bacterium]|nr:flagellar export protein FliJ [Gammaproteobacteria bacterium]
MKKRSARLKKIVALAEAEERNQRVLTGRSQSQLNQQFGRLGELNAYRQSYADKAKHNADLRSAHWKDYQNFLSKLDRAVRSQRQIVHDCEQSLETHRRQWMEKRQRLESLERVRERYQQEEHLHDERLEQRTQDDMPAAPRLYEDDK